MGALKRVVDAAVFAFVVLAVLLFAAEMLGIRWQFGSLFTFAGFIVAAFLIYSLIANK